MNRIPFEFPAGSGQWWDADLQHKYDENGGHPCIREYNKKGYLNFNTWIPYVQWPMFEKAKHEAIQARYQPLSMASALECEEFDFSYYDHGKWTGPLYQTNEGKARFFARDGKLDTVFTIENGFGCHYINIIKWFYPCDEYCLLDRDAHDAATALGVTLWKEGE